MLTRSVRRSLRKRLARKLLKNAKVAVEAAATEVAALPSTETAKL